MVRSQPGSPVSTRCFRVVSGSVLALTVSGGLALSRQGLTDSCSVPVRCAGYSPSPASPSPIRPAASGGRGASRARTSDGSCIRGWPGSRRRCSRLRPTSCRRCGGPWKLRCRLNSALSYLEGVKVVRLRPAASLPRAAACAALSHAVRTPKGCSFRSQDIYLARDFSAAVITFATSLA